MISPQFWQFSVQFLPTIKLYYRFKCCLWPMSFLQRSLYSLDCLVNVFWSRFNHVLSFSACEIYLIIDSKTVILHMLLFAVRWRLDDASSLNSRNIFTMLCVLFRGCWRIPKVLLLYLRSKRYIRFSLSDAVRAWVTSKTMTLVWALDCFVELRASLWIETE